MSRYPCAALAAIALLALPYAASAQPTTPRPLAVLLIAVEGAGQPFPSVDKDGKVVYIPQPASMADISTQPGGSVDILVVEVDASTRRLKVWTESGQLLVLELSPVDIAHIERGQFYTVLVRQR